MRPCSIALAATIVTTGRNPEAGLITRNGSLSGTTYDGGTSDAGTVFTDKPS
jgi:hypothetical protein